MPEARHNQLDGNWNLQNDEIDGDGGADVLLGDNGAIVSPVYLPDTQFYHSLRNSVYTLGYLDDASRTFMDDLALSKVDIDRNEDNLDGGDGNDEVLGQTGDDVLRGGNGIDTLRGGNGNDHIAALAGDRRYDDGADQPRLDLGETLGSHRNTNTTSVEQRLLLDAVTSAGNSATWDVGTTPTNPTGNDVGTVDPPTPVERTIELTPPTSPRVIGESVTLNATVTDLPVTATANIIWQITDAAGKTVAQGNGNTFTFAPPTAGTYTATAVMTDNEAGFGSETLPLTFANTRSVADPNHVGLSVLTIGGTDLDDDIQLLNVRNQPNSVEVRTKNGNGSWRREIFDNVSRIEVYGGAGDDDLSADRALTIPVALFGGIGDDKLRGGAGGDILVGGVGEDRLFGADGDDVLIGGLGMDRLDGGRDDDLLLGDGLSTIAGKTDHDTLFTRWSGSTDNTADRLAALIDDLTAASQNDGAVDLIDGDTGVDAFFATLTDRTQLRTRDQDVRHLF
jgi:Ca2+-binding RTX toxin-like protein